VLALTQAQVESRFAEMIKSAGMKVLADHALARSACLMDNGMPKSGGVSEPTFIMRWEGSDLSRLPDVLVSKLHSVQYRSAAVGVCDSAHPGQGFTSYKVAVLLY
jgi:hypothetical protein